MELKSLNCPNCGASVQIPDGVEKFFCTYCGSQIQIDDGKITIDLNANINLNHQYSDLARLKELELQEKQREIEKEESVQRVNREKKKKRNWLITTALTILIGGISAGLYEGIDLYFLFVVFIICIFMMPILALVIPDSFFVPENKPTTKGKLFLAFAFFIGGTAVMGGIHAIIFSLFKG